MKQIYVLAAILFLITGCRRHVDRPGGHEPNPASKVRITSSGGFTYTYDSKGRLFQSFYPNSSQARIEYTYTDKTVTGTEFGEDGRSFGPRIIYTLGDNGLASSDKFFLAGHSDSTITSYAYNTDRQLVEELAAEGDKAPVSRTIHYFSKGNEDSLKSFSLSNGKLLKYMRFGYYTDKPNSLSYENSGISYLGASNANLLKSYFRIELGDTTTTDITYEFDAQKRPSKSHIIEDGRPLSDVLYTFIELP